MMVCATADVSPMNWNTLITALAGVGGVIAGGWITGRHSKEERQNARRREQLKEF